MKNFVWKSKLVKVVCECCGQVFYAEEGTIYCPECEKFQHHSIKDCSIRIKILMQMLI